MDDKAKKEFITERIFDAPRELVWKAWTDQELVKKWWGPRGVFIPVCEVDAKIGGKLKIVMEAGQEMGDIAGTKWPMEGEFTELKEPERIVFTAIASDKGKKILEHTATITFEEEQGKTKMVVHVVVTKTTPEAVGAIAGMEAGWNQTLDKLGEFLTKETNA